MMAASLLGAALPVWATGEVLRRIWPGRGDRQARFFLALGLGTGLSSCVFFLWLLLVGAPGRAFCWIESALYLGVVLLCRLARRSSPRPWSKDSEPQIEPGLRAKKRLAPLFFVLLAFASAVLVVSAVQQPHGAWDAWAYWNMRARFLLRGGEHWTDSLSPEMLRVGGDYPLLLPGTTARLWCYAGEETVLVPAGVGVLFTLAIVGLAASAAWSVQRQATGLLAGAALLGTPYFIRHAAYQYADTPLAYYILGAIVLLYLAGRRQRNRLGLLALCGLMTGLAAWTKNEGLIFLGAVLIAHGAAATWKRGWRTAARESAWLGLGLLPVLALLVYYKLGLAPANDLAAAQDWRSAAAKLTDPARHWVITKHLGQAVLRYGNGLVFILAGYAALVGRTRQRATRAGLGEVWIIAGLMLAGYWVIYAVTPQDLEWHLETSANRLLLHLLPTVVLAFFLWSAGPEELPAPAATDRVETGVPG